MAEPEYRRLDCGRCGGTFMRLTQRGRLPRACPSCIEEEPAPAWHALQKCRQCGGEFTSRRTQIYCGRDCAVQAQVRKRYTPREVWLASPLKYLPPPKPPRCCAQCGEQFAPILQEAAIYCSRRCKRLAWQIKRNPMHGQRAAVIKAQAEAKRTAAAAYREAADALAVAKATAALAARLTECRACGLAYCPLPGSGRMVCCSSECSAELMRQGKRAARIADKARRRGVAVEVVNPIEVLKRGGWLCYLCGVDTPKRLRGTYDDDAPEVDHVVPIARGGVHAYSNLRCACRSCNGAKGDMLVDEYLATLPGRPQAAQAVVGDV